MFANMATPASRARLHAKAAQASHAASTATVVQTTAPARATTMRLSASGVHQQRGVPLLPLALVGEVSLYGTASHVVMACVDTIPLETQLSRIQNIQPHIVVGTPTRLARIADHSPHILGEKMRRMVDTIIVDEADLVFREPGGIKLVERLFRRRREEVAACCHISECGRCQREALQPMDGQRQLRAEAHHVAHAARPS